MSKIVVIGATGHIGTHLIPRLVRAGHDVVAVSRGTREPYESAPEWDQVARETIDRDAEEAAGTFGQRIVDLGADVVVDLVCFTPESATHIVDALRPTGARLVMCCTVWVHGRVGHSPVTEADVREPYGEYGTNKAEIERIVLEETRRGGLQCVVVHPGHISGPGWDVINPLGNLDPRAWTWLATGHPVPVPDSGLGLLAHVHADDVAQVFELACTRDEAVGESFHAVAAEAWNVRGLCRAAAGWFGREANLEPVSWDEFAARVGDDHAAISRDHLDRSIAASIQKGRALLGYEPQWTSDETLKASLRWLADNGRVDLEGADWVD